MANLTDDLGRLALVQTRLLVLTGMATQLRRQARLDAPALGKLCGVSGAVVWQWESGQMEPSPGQALAWLSAVTGGAVANSARGKRMPATGRLPDVEAYDKHGKLIEAKP